jgi:hypothetical protein
VRQKALKKKFWGCYVHTDLRKQFQEIARKHSAEPRSVYTFMTTAIVRSPSFIPSFIYIRCLFARIIGQDTRAMTATLGAIRVGIVNDNLQSAELLR